MDVKFDNSAKGYSTVAGLMLVYAISNSDDRSTMLIWMIAALAAGIAGLAMAIGTLREAQALADEEARRIAEAAHEKALKELESGQAPPDFALYLRPFRLEHEFHKQGWGWKGIDELFLHPPTERFDHHLGMHFDAIGLPLVCIGQESVEPGAGRVASRDEEWRERFRELAYRAKTVVAVPGRQAGIVSEIRWLRVTGQLRKTVFFKPAGYGRKEWEATAEYLEDEEGIELPEWSRRQISFRLYDSGRAHQVLLWKSTLLEKDQMRGARQIRALLQHVDPEEVEE